jgi:hypothetical protein
MCNLPICKCGFDSCLNGGQFIPSLCLCLCQPEYKGVRCEISATTLLTTATSTKNACQNLKCTNGGKFNENTCSCECIILKNFSSI